MTWEYRIIRNKDHRKLETELNALGREGWEAVSFSRAATVGLTGLDHYALLKRPLSESTP